MVFSALDQFLITDRGTVPRNKHGSGDLTADAILVPATIFMARMR